MLSDDFTTGSVSLVVAVTGHHELDDDDIPRYAAEIRLILGELKQKYPSTPLLLLSGLAEGADRIAVRVAREKEIAVPYVAILPMPEGSLPKTLLELAVLAGDREAAEGHLADALPLVGDERFRARTTADNLRMIRENRERRGMDFGWVGAIQGTLYKVANG
jgi:hypothetical protein